MTPAEEIRAVRVEFGLTQQQLADALFVFWVSVSRWETGTRNPGRLYLEAVRLMRRAGTPDIFNPATAIPAAPEPKKGKRQ